jgi:hypothetical protein
MRRLIHRPRSPWKSHLIALIASMHGFGVPRTMHTRLCAESVRVPFAQRFCAMRRSPSHKPQPENFRGARANSFCLIAK